MMPYEYCILLAIIIIFVPLESPDEHWEPQMENKNG